MTHLDDQQSPFLQFCKDSPIDWYPWDGHSIEHARKIEKPILLSIGYGICYWCYRMEKEVFSQRDVAQFFNQNFHCIKLDKDEHPHIDKLYMELSQLLLQSVPGWPLNMFLTNDLRPFFSIGYVPLKSSNGEVGMDELLPYLKTLWTNSKEELCAQAEEVVNAVERSNALVAKEISIARSLPLGVESILSISDAVEGGIKSLPKFAPTTVLFFLLRESVMTDDNRLSYYVDLTLKKMMQGSMIDPISGGAFHYANTADWKLPHEEKNLCDNLFLAELYIDGAVYFDQKSYAILACNLIEFIQSHLADPQGGFYSQEGPKYNEADKFTYAYSQEQLDQILTPEEKQYLDAHFSLDHSEENRGFFFRSKEGSYEEVFSFPVFQEIKKKLIQLKANDLFVDQKKICAWNAFAARVFFKAALYFDNESYRSTYEKTLQFIETSYIHEDMLYRRNIHGETKFAAVLDDYIALLQMYLYLYQMGEGSLYLQKALQWADQIISRFLSPDKGLYSVSEEQNFLFRKCEYHDGSLPAANGLAVQCFSSLYQITNQEKYKNVVDQILMGAGVYFESSSPFMSSLMQGVAESSSQAKKTIAIVLDKENRLKHEIQKSLAKQSIPFISVIWKEQNDKVLAQYISDIEDQEVIDGHTTLYVYDGVKKNLPISSSEQIMNFIEDLSNS